MTDRLEEIRARLKPVPNYMRNREHRDIEWLISEVERLLGLEEELDRVFTEYTSSPPEEFKKFIKALKDAFYDPDTQIGVLRKSE